MYYTIPNIEKQDVSQTRASCAPYPGIKCHRNLGILLQPTDNAHKNPHPTNAYGTLTRALQVTCPNGTATEDPPPGQPVSPNWLKTI
jgi:hypothetical protein